MIDRIEELLGLLAVNLPALLLLSPEAVYLLKRSVEKRSVRELGPERGRAMGPSAPETSPRRRESDRAT